MKCVDGKPQLKDIEKGYNFTVKCIRVFNRMGRLLLWNEVNEISHFGVVRDYMITLKGGGELWIDAGIIRMIVEHELAEKKTKRGKEKASGA